MKLRNFVKYIMILAALVANFACTGTNGSSSSTSISDSLSETFPSDLTVASPFDVTDSDSTSALSALSASTKALSSGKKVPTYTWATLKIDSIFSGTSSTACAPDLSLFITEPEDASCYGTAVSYQNHVDASGSESPNGTLPPGDVGIWLETDDDTGHACMAAEMNAQMKSNVQNKTIASLMGLATLNCAATVSGKSLPDASHPVVYLKADVAALGIADASFNAATISYDSSTGAYSYNLDLTYTPGSDSYDIVVEMEHTPSGTTGQYNGRLAYFVNDTYVGGNCPTSDVTYNGSIAYSRNSLTEIEVEARDALFCGHDTYGLDGNGMVDPRLKYSSTSDGWGNSFSILKAAYDPTTLTGNYVYTWQAGPLDGNSRSFNVKVDGDNNTAFAFFGFSDDIETTNGSIEGFICNWAGPGNNHTVAEFAQYQEISFDSSSGLFVSDAASLTYAPTTTCEYDGSKSFVYDTDIDGDLTDEDPALNISLAAGTMNLEAGQDLDSDTNATIEEVIDASGFVLP